MLLSTGVCQAVYPVVEGREAKLWFLHNWQPILRDGSDSTDP